MSNWEHPTSARRDRRAWPRVSLAAVAAALGAAVALAAQAPQGGQAQPPATQAQPPAKPPADPRQQRPTFRAGANYVRVDVYPTADGRPVTDLRAEDFEVFEDGVPQKIDAFEHVVVRAAGAQDARAEPRTVAESRSMAADPRSRVFVMFVDTYHTEWTALHQVRQPLVTLLDRVIGQDDLVAFMTPEMAASDIAFARKTATIEEMLGRYLDLGKRQSMVMYDPIEQRYQACYGDSSREENTVAWEMIQRRREKMTLDALGDLVVHLQGIRDERKAILAISDGWRLFRQNFALARGMPNRPAVGVDPRTGKLTSDPPPGMNVDPVSQAECDRDRTMLAQIDNERQFRTLVDVANRANASFYPIDPRGLGVFDEPIGPRRPPNAIENMDRLKIRVESLKTLALATDGVAVTDTNDIKTGITRIVDDLTSYYLIGYYSTNAKFDGRFRKIAVRVKRPRVDVRARRGYQAATEAEVAARDKAAGPSAPPSPVETALSALGGFQRETPARVRASYAWRPPVEGVSGRRLAALWIVGELGEAQARGEEWRLGGSATVTVKVDSGAQIGSAKADVSRAARSFVARLPDDVAVEPGDYLVRISIQPSSGGVPVSDAVHVVVPEPPPAGDAWLGQPLLLRRGPYTGVNYLPTADMRFRRRERLRVEMPVAGPVGGATARLLDRTGHPFEIPVSVTERQDQTGRWIVAETTLAPLAAGDYLVEIALDVKGAQEKRLVAFRIVP